MNPREIREKLSNVRMNSVDKLVNYLNPVAGARRLRSRMSLELFGAYQGASKTKRSLKGWSTSEGSADADILRDLPDLRERSRDLVRNNPVASGAIKTKVTNVVGTGLSMQSRIDREKLGLSDDEADQMETEIEREWRLFWESKDVDVARTLTGQMITRQAYQQTKENGDVFVLLPRVQRKNVPYNLKLQLIEADRVCNKNGVLDTERQAGGIKKDAYGAPVEYHILKNHPGNMYGATRMEWQVRKAFGEKTGLRNVIHLYQPTRPGQSRGVPDLAAVIEPLKQLSRYTEAEIMAAVVSGFFTTFIESDQGGGFDYSDLAGETGHSSGDDDLKLGNGLIMELNPGEKVHDSNPGRPNTSFDPFVTSVLRQIGTGLEIPFEILVKHFTASYSAARAALLELWKYVLSERKWLTDNFLKIVYEIWMYEAVAAGRIAAPGFFSDPAVRQAYLGCEFTGPAKGQIDELKEVRAASEKVSTGFSTLSRETAELTGGDWEKNHKQQAKERRKRIEDGLIQEGDDGNEE